MISEKRTPFLADELEQLRRQGLFRPLRILESAHDTEVIVDGKRVLNLSSNNYLGLTTDPRLKAAMIEATDKWCARSAGVSAHAGLTTSRRSRRSSSAPSDSARWSWSTTRTPAASWGRTVAARSTTSASMAGSTCRWGPCPRLSACWEATWPAPNRFGIS